MKPTFRGGAHPATHKETARVQTRTLAAPSVVHIPLMQGIGAPCKPLVAVGDTVALGQKIGDVAGLGTPVHASVSGKVIDIHKRRLADGRHVDDVVIENDGENRVAESVRPIDRPLTELSFEEILLFIREAGICGMGGAGFPTWAKLQSARGKAKRLIVNCAECEPYLTANHRLLLEDAESVVRGMKIVLAALGIPYGILAMEDNKRDAAEHVDILYHADDSVRVELLRTKYPQGDERQLIYALSGRQVPAGKLPADIGFIVLNAETCAAICNAYLTGMPCVSRIVTVSGDLVREPANLRVSIGTPYRNLIEACGGLTGQPHKVICGGPMMGEAVWSLDTPVGKRTAGILALSGKDDAMYTKHTACIRCGRCVTGCPMHLMPSYLAQFSRKKDDATCEKFDIFSCVECGTCTYLCPANVPIVQYIRVAKGRIRDARALRAAATLPPPVPAATTEPVKTVETKGGEPDANA